MIICFWCNGESTTKGKPIGRDSDNLLICKPCSTIDRKTRYHLRRMARELPFILDQLFPNYQRLNK